MPNLLYLIRHSYAENASGKSDFDRSLTPEGLNTVRELGRYLKKSDFDPAVILCSPAARAKETTQNLIEELGISEKNVLYREGIYNASVRELLRELNAVGKDKTSVVLVGHNPAITYLGEYLSGGNIGNMNPCGMVTIAFKNLDWSEVSQSSGSFLSHYHPKHLNV